MKRKVSATNPGSRQEKQGNGDGGLRRSSASGGTRASSSIISDVFGENVFDLKTMKDYMSAPAYESLVSTIIRGKALDPKIADNVAEAMKNWATERGATHFTHWFQPLTGATAEKHDSFLALDPVKGPVCRFSGNELIKGESDASSFPSGGLRATFEARGYTAWDPTSPAFIKRNRTGATLCIPTVFWSYHGESLDKKTPLLRSLGALTGQVYRLARLFGMDCTRERPFATLGAEQEYFLVDRKFYQARPDLLQTGRTLFGIKPAKHQQLDDHYYGVIKSRVLAFMNELDLELWKCGVPAKTRHNEVCPGQFEIALIYEELNLAVDHNMLEMEILRDVADRHGLACLLHEKPFAGMNGSGKHNNWSIHGPDGANWTSPGTTPLDNARFLTIICAMIQAVDTHAELLRAAVASAGNDRRLGANEAPPAIMSIFLGQQLSEIIGEIAIGARADGRIKGCGPDAMNRIRIGVSSLPTLPRDITDRNRTSPLAFTGNKFEFRAVGSSQSCAGATIVLNTIVTEALDDICSQLESDIAADKPFNDSLERILRKIVADHKRILFDGDSYSDDWLREAARRGLPNLKSTPESLEALIDKRTIALFGKYGVLSDRELRSRHEIYLHTYEQVITIEAGCAASMARTLIAPAALAYQRDLAETIKAIKAIGKKKTLQAEKLLDAVSSASEKLLASVAKLETAARKGSTEEMIWRMDELRTSADRLEELVPEDLWPLPSYADLMFMM